MRLVDLPRTGGFRLALLFLALFGTASGILFGFLYVQTHHFILAGIDDWLGREAPARFRAPLPQLTRRFDARARSDDGSFDRIFILYDAAGQVVAGDRLPLAAEPPVFDQPFTFSAKPAADMSFRGIAHRFPGGEVALIAQNLHEKSEFDEAFIQTAILGGALTAVLGLVGAVIVGAGTVRRLDALAGAIQEIVRGDLSRRLPSHGTSGDLDRLAHVVNGMLDDIERLMHDVKGVCDGIAHDLRTPLTRIMAGLERAQRQGGTQHSHAAAIDDAVTEIRGVLKTFAAMLRVSELESSARRAGFGDVDLEEVARDVVEFYEPVAEERGIALRLHPPPAGGMALHGDSSLLFDALANLVDNALKFTPPGGAVAVRLERAGDGVAIVVEDTGSGILPGEREAVLRRFYRGEESRHRPGNGLGLALVAAIARLHEFSIAIEPASPGTRITLRSSPLPAPGRRLAHAADAAGRVG